MILTDCPQCGQELRIADKYAGQTGRCDKCGAEVSVPVTHPPVAIVAPQRSLIECRDCGHLISPRAEACPKCGAPTRPIPVATIELTSKRLKAHLVFAFLTILGGLLFATADLSTGLMIVMVGLCWWLVARVRIWWHHE